MKTVRERYGVGADQLLPLFTVDTPEVTDDHGIVYKVVQDRYNPENKIAVLAFDYFRLYEDLPVGTVVSENLKINDTGLPICTLDPTKDLLNDWIPTIKVKKTAILGSRYEELTTEFNRHLIESEADYKRVMMNFDPYFYLKEIQYLLPRGSMLNEYTYYYKMLEAANSRITHIATYRAFKGDRILFNGFAFITEDGIAYVPFMWVTRDVELSKRHSPSAVFHARISLHLKESFPNLKLIDFGSYLGYKELLNFDRSYSKGLSFI